jgi:hypothetical protein
MSSRELNRVEVMGRVRRGELTLNDAAVLLELGYRQTKRCGGGIGKWAIKG